jgi:peptidoglycan hydrolase-like protein with peptidoglycan-binding domain
MGDLMVNTIASATNILLPDLTQTDKNRLPLAEPEILPDLSSLGATDYSLFSPDALKTAPLVEPLSLFNNDLPPAEKVFTGIPETGKVAPSFSEVKKGAVIQPGDEGPSVKELQTRLNKLGFKIAATGKFGKTTEDLLKQFQTRYGVSATGKFGPSTLTTLENAENANVVGKKLAETAKKVARGRNTIGNCYNAVADAIDNIFGDFLRGNSAYMAAGQLAANSKFKEIAINRSDLPKLPAGAVVVWGKTQLSPHGHISVSLGDGREASDHISDQLDNLRGYNNYRVFLPVKT